MLLCMTVGVVFSLLMVKMLAKHTDICFQLPFQVPYMYMYTVLRVVSMVFGSRAFEPPRCKTMSFVVFFFVCLENFSGAREGGIDKLISFK